MATLHEEVRIDGHEVQLESVDIGFAEAEDGSVAVSQLETSSVRIFSAEGEPLGTVGRAGEGPGEFRWIRSVGWRTRDSLAVYDLSMRRMTVVPLDRGEARTVSVGTRPTPLNPIPDFPHYAVMGANGSVMAVVQGHSSAESETREERVDLLGPDPGRTRTVVALVTDYPQVSARSSSWSASAPLPSVNLPQVRISHDGGRVLVVHASLEGEFAGSFTVTAIASSGDTLFHRRYAFEPLEATPAYVDSMLEVKTRDLAPPLAEAYREQARFPPLQPPVLGIIHGHDGSIWIRLRRSTGERTYIVLDESGEVVGRVPAPGRGGILLASRSHLWVVESDEWGVPSLVRFGVDWDP